MPVTPDHSGPYAPAQVVIDLIERHRSKGLPSPVTADVLARAGVSPSLTPRTLQALLALDLIDAEGKPSAALEGMRLAPEPEYRARMADWLKAAYADALQFVDPAADTEEQVRDAFRKYNPVGQQGRMVTLFMGLFRHAGLAPDKTPTGGAAQRKKPAGAAAPKPRVEKVREEAAAKPAVNGTGSGGGAGPGGAGDQRPQSEYMAALLAKFPSFDPAWPDEIKSKWFDGFATFTKELGPK